MKQLASLFWKEWHETRLFLLIGLGTFLGLPCICGLEAMYGDSQHQFQILVYPLVIAFGGVFAIFAAVGATSRDLNGHLEDFWRSRPVGTVQWFLVKYVVGLAIVLVACVLPLLAERWLGPMGGGPKAAAILMPFMWTAFYTLAFATGCLIRRPAHAAMTALAGILLIYCLPLVLPPLSTLNAFELLDHGRPLRELIFSSYAMTFAAGMLAITIAMLALAITAVRYQLHVAAGPRLMYGAVFSALLIIIGTAGYQVGTNLPILQQASLDPDEYARDVVFDGQRGEVVTVALEDWQGRKDGRIRFRFRSLAQAPAGFDMGESTPGPYGSALFSRRRPWTASLPGHPEKFYAVRDSGSPQRHDYRLVIRAFVWAQPWNEEDGQRLWGADGPYSQRPVLVVWRNRLFAIGDRLVTLDISNPLAPQLLSNIPFSFKPAVPGDAGLFTVVLPRVSGLPKEQRLDAALADSSELRYFPEEQILCQFSREKIVAWRPMTATDELATFEKIGEYDQGLLDLGTGSQHFRPESATMRDGLLYVKAYRWGYLNDRLLVFDLRSDHPLRPVGHFGAPEIWTICALPDGRALIGGSKLWLVGPPPSRKH